MLATGADRQLETVLACHALGLNRSWWTVTSQAATMCNFYASTWEEYHTGTLYLSAFSGPVEGILMIVAIYAVTAFHPLGQAFWSQPIFSLVPGHFATDFFASVDKFLGLKNLIAGRGWAGLEGLPINVAFMLFGGAGTIGNIANRCVCRGSAFMTATTTSSCHTASPARRSTSRS